MEEILVFVFQLRERDACGNTPFMTAIQCHNFKAAVYILDFVEKNKGIAVEVAVVRVYFLFVCLFVSNEELDNMTYRNG